MSLYALVLAGGSGTRFWPLSRRMRPKQLLPLLPPDAEGAAGPGATLLEHTLARISPLVPAERQFVVAPPEQVPGIRRASGLAEERILAEPAARNTAPAILFGTLAIAATAAAAGEGQDEACVAVLPSDHAIREATALRASLETAARLARERDAYVTFGIKPDSPNTGYGYIERGAALTGAPDAFRVCAFHEKPDSTTAERYVAAGRFYWNSGMFVFTVARLVRSFRRLYPALGPHMDRVAAALAGGVEPHPALSDMYAAMEATSIDYAVMEKETGLVVFEAPFSWSDVGAPSALVSVWGGDAEGNCVPAGVPALLDARGNVAVLSNPAKVVALLGVDDLVVLDSDEALLVCPKGRDQEIRRLVELLRARGREELL